MGAFDDLLAVQDHDTNADRLRHRRASLPERTELDARQTERGGVEERLADARVRRDEVAQHEKRLDDEAASTESKAKEVQRRLYGGTVTNVRELQALQADLEGLRRHRSQLEDRELEVMEQREGLDAVVASLEQTLKGIEGDIDRLSTAIAEQESAIDSDLDVETAARVAAALGVPAELLSTYEQLRAKNKGVGAARLNGDTCQGCRLALPATEIDRIRHLAPDVLARCEHCGAILVR